MFWARAQDPFTRHWFGLKTPDPQAFQCVTVLPKPVRRCPVILYIRHERHENSPVNAVPIVVRHLRERVTIARLPGLPHTVPEIWQRQITDAPGFAIIYVAALRSVGVPARLAGLDTVEFWDGTRWQPAPAPCVTTGQTP